VRVIDPKGCGCLYRFKIAGRWYLLKFLPPFEGTVSLKEYNGPTRVFASLEEAARFLKGATPE